MKGATNSTPKSHRSILQVKHVAKAKAYGVSLILHVCQRLKADLSISSFSSPLLFELNRENKSSYEVYYISFFSF